jgi:hypothetical protein
MRPSGLALTRRTLRQRVSAPLEPVDDPFVIHAQLCHRSASFSRSGNGMGLTLALLHPARLARFLALDFTALATFGGARLALAHNGQVVAFLSFAGLAGGGLGRETARTPRTITTDATT